MKNVHFLFNKCKKSPINVLRSYTRLRDVFGTLLRTVMPLSDCEAVSLFNVFFCISKSMKVTQD